jgi:threonine/homoserine efflux transporter RhtA
MSIASAFTWYLTYYLSLTVSPRQTMVAFYLTLSICGCLVSKEYICAFICCCVLSFAFLKMPEANIDNIFYCITCGLLGYSYMYLSEKYAKKHHLNSVSILSIRFYILLFMALYFSLWGHSQLSEFTSIHYNHCYLVLSIVVLVLLNLTPNFLAQKCIVLISTKDFSKYISITPVLTFFIEGAFLNNWDINAFLACSIVSITIFIVDNRKKTERSRSS